MKKLLFAAHDMSLGGIETSLINLLNYLVNNNYDITLVLEKAQGMFINDLDKKIHIIEYSPSTDKNYIKRKCHNLFKRIKFIFKHWHRYKFSASYATYSLMGSFVARMASSNCALWGHADYLALYKGDEEKVKEFFQNIKYDKFRRIVFVSKEACNTFTKIFPDMKKRVIYCNNMINREKIEKLAKEEAQIKASRKMCTFINVGRHDEQQKKLTRIIEASKKLKEEGLKFRVLFVGDGPDSIMYKEMVDKYNLNENIIFLGQKNNPYPYIKISDYVILTSDYEGYPVVFSEAMVLEKPIITTDISDAKEVIDNNYGTVIGKKVEEVYQAMKQYIRGDVIVKSKFDVDAYNNEIKEILDKIIKKKV